MEFNKIIPKVNCLSSKLQYDISVGEGNVPIGGILPGIDIFSNWNLGFFKYILCEQVKVIDTNMVHQHIPGAKIPPDSLDVEAQRRKQPGNSTNWVGRRGCIAPTHPCR